MSFTIENKILRGVEKPIGVDSKLGQLVYDVLSENPDHVMQIDAETGEKTTCGQMKDRSVRCALWMQKFGVGPDDIVVVVTHNHLDAVVPVFATFFVDAIFTAWNQSIALYSARRYMKKFTPKLIFTCEKTIDVLAEAAKLEDLDVKLVVFGKNSKAESLDEILESQSSEEVEKFEVVNARSPEDVAAVLLSSGSTGFPKGVMMKTRSLLAMIQPHSEALKVSLNYLWYSTLDWVSCISFVLRALMTRSTRIIPGAVEVESFLQTVEKYKVNFAFLPPILISYVAKSNLVKNYDLRSLKIFMVGGSKHSKSVLEELRRKFPTTFVLQGYGGTESGAISYSTPKTKHIESTGIVVANCQVKFVDLKSGEALGPNQKGEVVVKTPNVMIGYYEDPEATAKAFDAEGWYRTGDIGYYDEEGEIFIVDRIKDIMKYRNYQIAPAEIEELLHSHPEVQEAAVVAIPHELDGDWPAAFVKKTPGSRITADDIMKLTSVLEEYKKLRGGVYFVDSLPQTGSGKVAKNELRQLAINLLNNKGSL